MNLRFFRTENIDFSEDMLASGHQVYEAGLQVFSTNWAQAAGPVWATTDGLTNCGFQIDREALHSSVVRWRPHCSCKRCQRGICSHVVALFYWIEREAKDELERWQDHLDESIRQKGVWAAWNLEPLPSVEAQFQTWIAAESYRSQAEQESRKSISAPKQVSSERVLFIICRSSSDVSEPPSIDIGISRPLKTKKGGSEQMAKMAWLGRHDFTLRRMVSSDPTLRRFVEWSAVNDIAHRTMNAFGDGDSDEPSVHVLDDEGFGVVAMIAQEDRLYALNDEERPIGPLRLGDARKLEWTWEEWKANYWRVRPAAMQGADLFVSSLPMYVDKVNKVFGRLDLEGMPPSRAVAMMASPPIPKAWIHANAQSSEAVRCLPRPPQDVVKRSTQLIRGVTPTPVLTVAVSGDDEVFSIDIAFRYEDVTQFFMLAEDAVQFIRRGRGTIELVRDLQAEAKALDAVANAGMIVAKGGTLRFMGARDEQIKGFRSLLATDFAPFRTAGFEIHTVEGWSSRVVRSDLVDGGLAQDAEGGATSALTFSLGFFLDGQRYNLLPLVPQLLDLVGGADGIKALQGRTARPSGRSPIRGAVLGA